MNYGPSPRGWGKLWLPFRPGRLDRTIPTRVGKTKETGAVRGEGSDHPHAGGENTLLGGNPSCFRGPSPRGWGKLNDRHVEQLTARTIPTRVGKTVRSYSSAAATTDHPHAGGENAVASLSQPPKARTIPTRVGKTL